MSYKSTYTGAQIDEVVGRAYSAGTFTPALSGGLGTVTLVSPTNTGKYINIGNIVFFSVWMTVDSVATPGNAKYMTGLPLTCVSSGAVSIYMDGFEAAATTMYEGYVNTTDNKLYFSRFVNGSIVGNPAPGAEFMAGSSILVTGFYFV